MINFATLQGLTIPEGVVTQIADASGRVLWALNVGGPVVLEVAKITSDTYAGETTYTGEQFILLDIYPKTNGTVKVTYGGLTKTITDTSGAAEPNAQKVFFGTFNGVTDEVETPASGTLTIEGSYVGVGVGSYSTSKSSGARCSCVNAISNWGVITEIPASAFYACNSISEVILPATLKSLYFDAFAYKNTVGDTELYLTIMTLLSETPPMREDAADNVYFQNTLFVVPDGCGEAYKEEEGWRDCSAQIAEKSQNTFSVAGVQYEMVHGMTWDDWVKSDLNTDGFTVVVTTVKSASGAVVRAADDSSVTSGHLIFPSKPYTLSE